MNRQVPWDTTVSNFSPGKFQDVEGMILGRFTFKAWDSIESWNGGWWAYRTGHTSPQPKQEFRRITKVVRTDAWH